MTLEVNGERVADLRFSEAAAAPGQGPRILVSAQPRVTGRDAGIRYARRREWSTAGGCSRRRRGRGSDRPRAARGAAAAVAPIVRELLAAPPRPWRGSSAGRRRSRGAEIRGGSSAGRRRGRGAEIRGGSGSPRPRIGPDSRRKRGRDMAQDARDDRPTPGDDDQTLGETLARATTVSCSLGPFLKPVMTRLFACAKNYGPRARPTLHLCRADLPLMNRGDVAAGTWVFRRTRPRPRRGYSAETSRGATAAATWIFRGNGDATAGGRGYSAETTPTPWPRLFRGDDSDAEAAAIPRRRVRRRGRGYSAETSPRRGNSVETSARAPQVLLRKRPRRRRGVKERVGKRRGRRRLHGRPGLDG